jgi:nitrate reductase gamma subunit
MDGVSLIFNVLAYLALAIFWVGVGYRLWLWAETPVPLKIPTTPAPTTLGGVIARMAGEIVLFRSLFRGDKALWLGGWTFHGALLIILLKHLRYFLFPVPGWVAALNPVGVYAGLFILLPLLFLLVRRFTSEQVRYISVLSDYLVLLLLLAIVATGLLMKFVAGADVVAVKAFMLGIITLSPTAMPASPWFMVHFSLVLLLVVYFPFSKLMHVGGVFLSPTRNQRDDGRIRRYVNPWDYPAESGEFTTFGGG